MSNAGLAQFKDFKDLSGIDRNWLVTDGGLLPLKGLTGLRVLELSGTWVGDAGLKELRGLTALQTLGLSSTWVRGPGLKELAGMKGLQALTRGCAPWPWCGRA